MRLRHLITLEAMPREILDLILERAQSYVTTIGGRTRRTTELKNRVLGNLFFEASTRTRVSMEIAARHLSADVVNLDADRSSTIKGESLLDTVLTLMAMGIDVFAIRVAEAGACEFVAENVGGSVAVINCGEGATGHPTQGLLDLLAQFGTKLVQRPSQQIFGVLQRLQARYHLFVIGILAAQGQTLF